MVEERRRKKSILVDRAVTLLEQHQKESEEDLQLRPFTELFNKLPFPEMNFFPSQVIRKFKRERQFAELIFSFRRLDACDQ